MKSTYMIAIICIAGLLTGMTLAAAITPIWSNTKSYTSTYQAYSTGTLVLNFPSQSGPVGQAITLTATLNPLPTQYQAQQVVTFYFSYLSTASSSTQITGDPTTGLALVGPDLSHSSATSINGVASITMTPQTTGTFYFIAEIAAPT